MSILQGRTNISPLMTDSPSKRCSNPNLLSPKLHVLLERMPAQYLQEVRKHRELAANNWTRRDDSGRVLNDECPKLTHSPYVCNGCKQKPYCHLKRLVYRAKSAQKDYEALRSESRTGIALNKASFWDTDRKLREGIKKGQHIYHIMQTEEIQASQATVYRYIKKGYCSFSPIELPRMVKFRSRKPRQLEYVPYGAKKGRAYEDFQQHIAANHITHWVEMDTVIGRVGGKVLLTMLFTNSNFMFGRLLPNKTAPSCNGAVSNPPSEIHRCRHSLCQLFLSYPYR